MTRVLSSHYPTSLTPAPVASPPLDLRRPPLSNPASPSARVVCQMMMQCLHARSTGVTRLGSPTSPRIVPVDAAACRAHRDPGIRNRYRADFVDVADTTSLEDPGDLTCPSDDMTHALPHSQSHRIALACPHAACHCTCLSCRNVVCLSNVLCTSLSLLIF